MGNWEEKMAYITFITPFGHRLYDREQNRIIHLQLHEYKALENVKMGCGTKEDYAILRKLQNHGFCCASDLNKIEHPATKNIETIVRNNINQIVLQITQNCNLRCSYCTYSGNYYNRTHSKKSMDVKTALAAVDFLMLHSSGVEEVAISFYGGEPILEFELIKSVVHYVKQNYPEKKVRYNLTTNLTMFNDYVIDFLIKNDVSVMISIDGPEKVQDKYRVFSNGKGSYSTVVSNAKRICEKSKEYFAKCLTNTVISPGSDYRDILDFLDGDELFGPLYSTSTLVNDDDSKIPISYDDDYYCIYKKEKFKLMLAMLGLIDFESVSSLVKADLTEILKMDRLLLIGGTHRMKAHHPGGPCIPGQKRVFVDVNGYFYPCEKIAEVDNFKIGDITHGLDYEKIRQMINVGKCTEDECLKCWAFLYCGTCVAKMVTEGRISRKKRLEQCGNTKDNLLRHFQDLETLRFYGCDFKQLEEK